MKKMRPNPAEQFCTYNNELERELAVKEEILSAYKRTYRVLKNKTEDLEVKIADLRNENAYLRRILSPTYKLYEAGFFGDDKSRPNDKDAAIKKIEEYIEEAREYYFKAKREGRADGLTEYAHGVLRGLLDAFYVVGGMK